MLVKYGGSLVDLGREGGGYVWEVPTVKVQTPITDNLSISAYHILGYQEGVIFGA